MLTPRPSAATAAWTPRSAGCLFAQSLTVVQQRFVSQEKRDQFEEQRKKWKARKEPVIAERLRLAREEELAKGSGASAANEVIDFQNIVVFKGQTAKIAVPLFAEAKAEKKVAQVSKELDQIAQMMTTDSKFSDSIETREKGDNEVSEYISAGFGGKMKIADMTARAVIKARSRNIVAQLPDVADVFRRMYDNEQGVVYAVVTTAEPLGKQQHARIEERIQALVASSSPGRRRTVRLTANVNPDVLGGLSLTVGDRELDMTVRSRISSLDETYRSYLQAAFDGASGDITSKTPSELIRQRLQSDREAEKMTEEEIRKVLPRVI